jgi:hypothetical protein
MGNLDQSSGRSQRPPAQSNLKRATQLAFDALDRQADEQLRWLGAEPWANGWQLPVLNEVLAVDLGARRVTASASREVGPSWRFLALHYLAISARPERLAPEITFADLPTARSYADVYRQRALARLCRTAGRDAGGLRAAAAALGAGVVDAGDAAFDFLVFPRLAVRLIWYAADEEFPPSATLLLPANVECCFCAEDIVVLSECLVSRLAGRPF